MIHGAHQLEYRFHAGEVILVACWGGHGRTGTVIACLLARLHGLTGREGAKLALELTRAMHMCRVRKNRARSPSSPAQFAQVKRLVAGFEWDDDNES